MHLKALIFDVDGTLADTEEVHRAAFNEAFKDASLDWHWDRQLYGRLLKTTGGRERISHFVATFLRAAPSPDLEALVAVLHRRKTTLYTQMIAGGILDLRPGVREVIEGARQQKVRLAIATTTSRPNVDSLLRATLGADGQRYFEMVAAGDSVAVKKPSPEVFLQVLAALRLEGRACLAIEDTENGLRAARAASIPTLITTTAYSRSEDFQGAAAVVSALADLVSSNCDRDGRLTPSQHELFAALRLIHGRSQEVVAATQSNTL